MWNQVYNPFDNAALSTHRRRNSGRHAAGPDRQRQGQGAYRGHHRAGARQSGRDLVFTMPAGLAIRASVLGVVTGFFPIGWIVLNVIFLYQLTVATGRFEAAASARSAASPRTGACSCC